MSPPRLPGLPQQLARQVVHGLPQQAALSQHLNSHGGWGRGATNNETGLPLSTKNRVPGRIRMQAVGSARHEQRQDVAPAVSHRVHFNVGGHTILRVLAYATKSLKAFQLDSRRCCRHLATMWDILCLSSPEWAASSRQASHARARVCRTTLLASCTGCTHTRPRCFEPSHRMGAWTLRHASLPLQTWSCGDATAPVIAAVVWQARGRDEGSWHGPTC